MEALRRAMREGVGALPGPAGERREDGGEPGRTRRGKILPRIVAVLCLAALAASAGAAGAADLSPAEAERLIGERAGDPRFVVLDVRTPEEFRSGHLRDAVLLDFRSPAFREGLDRLDREKTYLLYCRTGNRSRSAAGMMEEMGFRRVDHLDGGIVRWMREGRPTEEAKGGGR